MAASTEEQLAAIASFGRALDGSAIGYWLFGGWAVDFWIGAVTRGHDDVDAACRLVDADAIGAALAAAGWRHSPDPQEPVGTRYTLGGALFEITFVTADHAGRVLIPFPEQPVVWSHEPFGDERRTLDGVSARVIPLALLRAGKAAPRGGATDAAKDRADHEALLRAES